MHDVGGFIDGSLGDLQGFALAEGYVEHYNNVHSKGHARRAPAGDSSRAGSEVGRGEGTAEESPPGGGVMDETDCSR